MCRFRTACLLLCLGSPVVPLALAASPPTQVQEAPDAARQTGAASAGAARERPSRATTSGAVAARAARRAEAARRLQQEIDADQARIKAKVERRQAQPRKATPLPSPASAP